MCGGVVIWLDVSDGTVNCACTPSRRLAFAPSCGRYFRTLTHTQHTVVRHPCGRVVPRGSSSLRLANPMIARLISVGGPVACTRHGSRSHDPRQLGKTTAGGRLRSPSTPLPGPSPILSLIWWDRGTSAMVRIRLPLCIGLALQISILLLGTTHLVSMRGLLVRLDSAADGAPPTLPRRRPTGCGIGFDPCRPCLFRFCS